MPAESVPTLPTDSIEALKRVRATEIEWDEKLRAAKKSADEAAARLREESEAAVRAAQSAAETERARAVQEARTTADAEAAQIVSEGTEAARAASRGEGKRPVDRKNEVLDAVLSGFDSD
ncbi:MAG: hypothetical protein WBE40_03135 [Thermoplasmata archaeon]